MSFSATDIFGVDFARAAAKSTRWNPKNLEYHWYSFWTRAVFQVASRVDIERCSVSPQFPLWRIWTSDDTQLGNITVLSEEDDPIVEDSDSDSDADDHNDNSIDTISTLNETLAIKTRARITDFALLYWTERIGNEPHQDDEDPAIVLIENEFIVALIEIKRAASRKLRGEDLASAQKILMLHAQETVFRQALYLFANKRWSRQQSVLVIAAVGDIWTYTVVSRVSQETRTAGADETNPEWEPDASEFEALEWSQNTIWGREEDADYIQEVTTWIVTHFLEEVKAS